MTPGLEIQKKAAGLPVALSSFNTPGNIADYSVQAIRAALPASVSMLAIDAMSSGNDTLPLLRHPATGTFWISQGTVAGWAVLHLGMEADPTVGNAVMGYYFDNPSFPQQLRNGIYYELLPSDFPAGSVPSSLDIAMGMLEDNHGRLEVGSSPVINRVYFSLTPASAQTLFSELQAANALLSHASGGTYTPPAPGYYTGATLFVASFDVTGSCYAVNVCEDWQSLVLDQDDDVDALAVAWAQALTPPNQSFQPLEPNRLQYVFSLGGPNPGEELRVAADVTIGAGFMRYQGPLRGNNGNQIVGSGGSLRGRVRAICSQDPEGGFRGAAAYGEPDDHGTPTCPLGQPCTNVLSLSLAARITSPFGNYTADQFVLTGVLSGWGDATPEDSLVSLYLEIVGGPLHGFQTNLAPWFRPAAADYQMFSLPIDAPWLGTWADPEVPGPTLPNKNRCRFWVVQAGLSHTTESFRSLVFRSQ